MPAKKNGNETLTVTLPFLRETKNTYVYAFSKEELEKADPKPFIESLYIRKEAGPQRESVTLVVT